MNTPSPLIPQGSLLEQQKNRTRSRVKVAFFCVVGAHLLGLMVLLIQGCKREAAPPPPEPALPTLTDTNLPPVVESNLPPPPTNVPAPPTVELPPPPPPSAPAVQEYVVQKGDTFDSIGRKYGISWKAIQEANPNVNPTRLQIGQKIVIPAPSSAAAPRAAGAETPATTAGGERIYIVKSGDTLTKIAKMHGTTVKALRAANKLRTDRIRVGDKLIIPGGTAPAAPAPPESAPASVPPPPAYGAPPTSSPPPVAPPSGPPPGR